MSTRSVTSDIIFRRGSPFGHSSTALEQTGHQMFTYIPTPPLTPKPENTGPCSKPSRKLRYSPPPSTYISPEVEFVDINTSTERGFSYESYSPMKFHRQSGRLESSFSSSSFYNNDYQQEYIETQITTASSSTRDFSPNLEIVGLKIPVPPTAGSEVTRKWHHQISTQSQKVELRSEIKENFSPSYSGLPSTIGEQVFNIKGPPPGQSYAEALKVKQQKSMQLMNEERQKILESSSEKFSGHKVKEKKSKKKSKAEKRCMKDLTDLPPILHQKRKPFFPESKKQRRVVPVAKVSKKDEEFLKKMDFQLGQKNKLPSISPQ